MRKKPWSVLTLIAVFALYFAGCSNSSVPSLDIACQNLVDSGFSFTPKEVAAGKFYDEYQKDFPRFRIAASRSSSWLMIQLFVFEHSANTENVLKDSLTALDDAFETSTAGCVSVASLRSDENLVVVSTGVPRREWEMLRQKTSVNNCIFDSSPFVKGEAFAAMYTITEK